MVRWMRWYCSLDTVFEFRALAVWGRVRYFSVTEAPHNIESLWVSKEEIFCFFESLWVRWAGRIWDLFLVIMSQVWDELDIQDVLISLSSCCLGVSWTGYKMFWSFCHHVFWVWDEPELRGFSHSLMLLYMSEISCDRRFWFKHIYLPRTT